MLCWLLPYSFSGVWGFSSSIIFHRIPTWSRLALPVSWRAKGRSKNKLSQKQGQEWPECKTAIFFLKPDACNLLVVSDSLVFCTVLWLQRDIKTFSKGQWLKRNPSEVCLSFQLYYNEQPKQNFAFRSQRSYVYATEEIPFKCENMQQGPIRSLWIIYEALLDPVWVKPLTNTL